MSFVHFFCAAFCFCFWPPTPRLGQQQPQVELPSSPTVPYIISPLYTKVMCVPYTFLSRTHTHTGTLAHPLWPGTPCGKSWGATGALSSFTLSIVFAWPRLVARRFFLYSTGFSFGLENSLSKDFHQHVIAATWLKFSTATECMLVQVCASLCKSLTHSVGHK